MHSTVNDASQSAAVEIDTRARNSISDSVFQTPPLRMHSAIARKLRAIDVIDVLSDLFILRASPLSPLRQRTGVRRQGIAGMDRGCRCQDRLHRGRQPVGERLHRELQPRLRDELLNGESFYTLCEAQIVIEGWRRRYKTIRPHASIG